MRKVIPIILLLTMSFQIACSYAVEGSPKEIDKYFATQVFAGRECLFPKPIKKVAFLGAIAAAVLPSLIEKSLSRFATAIRKAGEKSVTSISSSTNAELSFDDTPKCIQIVHGNFFLKKEQFESFTKTKGYLLPLEEGKEIEAYEKLSRIGAYIADPPYFFFEGHLRLSRDKSAIAISPTVLIYDAMLESTDRKSGIRDIVLSFAFSAAGQSGMQEKGTLGQLQFLKLKTGSVLRFPDLSNETPWIPIQMTENLSPRIIAVTASETDDANEFLLFIADVLDGSKDQVETVLKQTLIENERVKLKQQELEAEKTKQQAETEALVNAQTSVSQAQIALLDYNEVIKEPSSKRQVIIQKGNDALTKMLTANLRASHAGLAVPFQPQQILEIQKELAK